MKMDYININPELNIPIYQQLVDAIIVAIRKEMLVSGQKLPTVQEMAETLGIARGTVKRAYDELEHVGLIEKVQGRGTFVRYNQDTSASRKEKAMIAISKMFDYLEDMGLSPQEISIFINLKLRERSEKEANVKVIAIECNPENLSQISEQLRHINGVDLYSFLLDNVKQYPYKINEDFELIITTSSHAEYLEKVVPMKNRVIRVALRPSARSLSKIIKIESGKTVGIITGSRRFGELLFETSTIYSENIIIDKPLICADGQEIKSYIKGKDVLLLPIHYEKYLTHSAMEYISNFDGEIIECYYEMDEGSLLYLETKIKRLLNKKSI
jgi:DNA-binding transcriptional regulator YhcF (GntR family)